MAKYRVTLRNKEVETVEQTTVEAPQSDTMLEERTGETIYAIIEAASDGEAQEKAGRLASELQTRQTRRDLDNGRDEDLPVRG